MAGRNIKVCILRARHDLTVPTISEQACLEMLMIGEGSVFRYWTDVTGGFLDFIDSTLQPWVDISIGPEEPREKSAEKAFQATKDAGGVLGGFDVFMVLLHPGTYVVPNPMAGQPGQGPTLTRGQPGGAGFLLQGKQGCTLPVMTGTQTFFCHELGHTFGFEHSYGVLNNGSDWDGIAPFTLNPVYGDPYDLMSSETFGARWLDPSAPKYGGHPTFTEAVPNGWPSQTGAQRGPMISRSHMMVWDARSLPTDKVRRFTYPMTGEVINVRLGTASRSATDPTLIELHPPSEALFPGGTFFCSLELRTRNGWDRGLKLSGTDLSRQAVVAHTTQQADNRIVSWYRGQISVPLEADTDLAPAFTPIVVRVTQVAPDLSSVDLEISSSGPREVRLEEEPGAVVLSTDEHATVLTPCGDELLTATRLWSSGNVYRIRTRGYGGTGTPGVLSPKVTWTVQGQSPDQPEGELFLITPSGLTTVTYFLLDDGATLVVLHSDAKSFTADVVATVSEPDRSFTVTRQATFVGIGAVTGLTDEDEQKLADCVVRLIQLGGDRNRPNAARLTGLAVDLVRAGLLEQAARVQQGAVELLRPLAAGPDPAVRVELADALHNYTIRLLDIDRAQEAAQTADEAITVYHEASGLAGADQATILREVTIFANALSHNRIFLHPQATRAQEEEVRLLRSTGGTDAASQVQLADALHTLTVRLIEVDRRADAAAAAEEAITRYADAARLPDADHNKIISELRLFGNELASNGLPDLADRARQAADRIM